MQGFLCKDEVYKSSKDERCLKKVGRFKFFSEPEFESANTVYLKICQSAIFHVFSMIKPHCNTHWLLTYHVKRKIRDIKECFISNVMISEQNSAKIMRHKVIHRLSLIKKLLSFGQNLFAFL